EEPKLRERPAAHEERGTGAPSWVHRGAGDGDADEVNEGEGEPNGQSGEAFGSPRVGGPEDDDEEHEGQDHFGDEASLEVVPLWAVLAIAVGGKAVRGAEGGDATGD